MRECLSSNNSLEPVEITSKDKPKKKPMRPPLVFLPKSRLEGFALRNGDLGGGGVVPDNHRAASTDPAVPRRPSRPPLPSLRISRLHIRRSNSAIESSERERDQWRRVDFIHDSAANTHACNVRWAFVPESLGKCEVLLSGIEGGRGGETLVARERGAIDYPLPNGDRERVFGVLFTPDADLGVEKGRATVLFSTGLLATENTIGSNFREGGHYFELTRRGVVYPEIKTSCPSLYVDQQFIPVLSSSKSRARVLKNKGQECPEQSEESENNYYSALDGPEETDESSEREAEIDSDAEPDDLREGKPLSQQVSAHAAAERERRRKVTINSKQKKQLASDRIASEKAKTVKLDKAKRKKLEALLHARIHPGKTKPILNALNKAYNAFLCLHDEPCDACCFAKGKYRPVKVSVRRRAHRVGERLHYDIFTAGVRSSRFGVKYLLVVIDEFSDYSWSFALKKKSEADHVLRTLVSHLEKKLAKRVEDVEWEGFLSGENIAPGVASMRSDNAGETMNKKSFQVWARKGGIWLETSNAGQQWQNGKAERVGGLIWKGGESFRYAANLPAQYWPFTCRAFNYVRNRLPTARRPDKTPFEIFEQLEIPLIDQIESFRTIGSLCYILVHPDERVGKRAATERGMMLGYADEPESTNDVMGGKKGYVVCRLSDGVVMSIAYNQLYESHEHVFPFPKISVYDAYLKREIVKRDKENRGKHEPNSNNEPDSGVSREKNEPNNDNEPNSNNEPNSDEYRDESVSSEEEVEEVSISDSSSKQGLSPEVAADNADGVNWNDLNTRADLGLPPLEPPTPYLTRHAMHERSSALAGSAGEDCWIRSQLADEKVGEEEEKLLPRLDSVFAREGNDDDRPPPLDDDSDDEEEGCEILGIRSFKRTGKKGREKEYLVEWREDDVHTYTWEPAKKVCHTTYYKDFRQEMKGKRAHETTHAIESRHGAYPMGGHFTTQHSLIKEIGCAPESLGESGSNVGESGATFGPNTESKQREEAEVQREINSEIKKSIARRIVILKIIVKGGKKVPETRPEAQRDTVSWPKWLDAEEKELQSFEDFKVWRLVPRPRGKNVIKVRWVYDVKLGDNFEIKRYKARLVAKGFTQKEGIDFHETFAPTMHIKSMRVLLALAAHDGVDVHQYDVSTAFLHASLDQETYVEQPPGHINPNFPDHVYMLDKAMYGLRNAPRAWSDHLMNILKDQGYTQSSKDDCLWSKWQGSKYIHLLFHVDDMLCVSNDDAMRDSCYKDLEKKLSLKHEGLVTMFLGVRVSRLPCGGFALDQKHYIEKMAERFLVTDDARDVEHPHEYGKPGELSKEQLPKTLEEKRYAAQLEYQALVGCLIYAAKTRVDVQYDVSDVSRFMCGWGKAHWKAALRILRYLYSTRDRALLITKSESPTLVLTSYADANYGDERESAEADDKWMSQGGYLMFVGGSLVSWSSRRHKCRTLSSMEAEYVEASEAAKEVAWLRVLLEELGHKQLAPTVIHEDNKACISYSKNNTCHDRTKHIDIRAYALRDRVREGMIVLSHIETKHQLADMLTKTQLKRTFMEHRDHIMDGLNTSKHQPGNAVPVANGRVCKCMCLSCWVRE